MAKEPMAQVGIAQELLKHRGSLFGFSYSLVRDFALAEDLFQEACARILARQDQFVTGTNFGAWARSFLRAIAFEQQRWRSRILISQEASAATSVHFERLKEGAVSACPASPSLPSRGRGPSRTSPAHGRCRRG